MAGRKPNPNTEKCPICNAPMHMSMGKYRCSVGGHRSAGRPPDGEKAMTATERKQKQRARK